jgi:serine/threonine protein kinase
MQNSDTSELEYLRKDYKIKDKIGEGTYGLVYLVRHRTTKVEYAAKYIKNFTSDLKLA